MNAGNKNFWFADEMMAWMKSGHIVITANQRQSRFLKEAFARAHPGHVGRCANVFALQPWLCQQYEALRNRAVPGFSAGIASDLLCRELWHTVVSQSDNLPDLINRNGLSAQLAQASLIRRQYHLPERELKQSTLDETQLLMQLEATYLQRLQALNLVDYSTLCFKLAQVEHLTTRDNRLVLYGFAQLAPLLYEAVIRSAGTEPAHVELRDHDPQCRLLSASDPEQEFKIAAHWAKQQAARGRKANGDATDLNIAIVVPELHRRRKQIEHWLFDTLERSRYQNAQRRVAAESFDISVPEMLIEQKPVLDALRLLHFLRPQQQLAEAIAVLQSDYWGGGFNSQRAAVLQQLRRSVPGPNIAAASIYAQLQADVESSDENADETPLRDAATHPDFRLFAREARAKRSFYQWTHWIRKYLQACHWPGPRTLGSVEYQQVQQFMAQLDEIATLDALYEALSLSGFIARLEKNLHESPCQIEVKQPQIRVLGLMEAAGLKFDACFVCGLNERTLPEAVKPNPFLPLDLQQRYDTPSASVERERAYASALLETLQHAAPEIVFSFVQENDEGPQRPSPLLPRGLIPENPGQFANATESLDSAGIKSAQPALLDITPGLAPPIPTGGSIPGGVGHLDLFAANPLFAFFRFRLGIDIDAKPSQGMDARQRGIALHWALANLCSEHPSSTALSALSDIDTRAHTLQNLARRALAYSLAGTRLAGSVYRYEAQRLQACLDAMWHFEQARGLTCHFSVEQAMTHILAGRELHLRIDRVDRIVTDAREDLIIIDYKSRAPALSKLEELPLTQHQLPLYASYQGEAPVLGVAYLELAPEHAKLSGLSDPARPLPGLAAAKQEWQALCAAWQQALSERAADLCRGRAHYQRSQASIVRNYQHYERAVRAQERVSE